jgi:Flp pilus assembly protein TadG
MNAVLCNNQPHRHRGLAIVEFVIVLPILLLMLFAVAELGRAIFQYNTLTKAVRDSARYYSVNTTDTAGATSLVQYDKLTGNPLLPLPLPVVPPPLFDGNWVTVTASYQFQFLPGNPLSGMLGWFGTALPNPFILTATCRMRAI